MDFVKALLDKIPTVLKAHAAPVLIYLIFCFYFVPMIAPLSEQPRTWLIGAWMLCTLAVILGILNRVR